MVTCCNSQGNNRIITITTSAALLINVLGASTIIWLVGKKANDRNTTVNQDGSFKNTLEKVYESSWLNLHSSQTRTAIQERAAPSLEFLSLLKPVVHLSGLDFDRQLMVTTKQSPIRNWALSEGSERYVMYNGMTYENGSIIIPVTGVYFIYSHLKFYVEDNKKQDTQNMFFHGMFRYSALTKSEDILLSNQVTECKEGINDGAHLEYPSDINSVVHLTAGDQLIVKVSNFRLLKHDRDWHYIGAYLV